MQMHRPVVIPSSLLAALYAMVSRGLVSNRYPGVLCRMRMLAVCICSRFSCPLCFSPPLHTHQGGISSVLTLKPRAAPGP
ncbi:hypothetical protein DFH29DRAFT_952455 [Suillus ampliporus]|nr:hypothetical protein DFH29DRAFT_952455 [Suillus ampliporus]